MTDPYLKAVVDNLQMRIEELTASNAQLNSLVMQTRMEAMNRELDMGLDLPAEMAELIPSVNPFKVDSGTGLSVILREGVVFFKTLGPYASPDYTDIGPNAGTLFSNSMTLGKYKIDEKTISSLAANDTTAICLELNYEAVPTPASSTIYQETGEEGMTSNPIEVGLWQHTLSSVDVVKDTCTVFNSDVSLDTLTNSWAAPSAGVETVTIYYPIAVVTTDGSVVTDINQIVNDNINDPYSGHAYLVIA